MLEKVLEKICPNKKEKYLEKYLNLKYKLKMIKLFFKKRTDYYLLGTPEYGNLGDHAIAEAEKKFINDCGKSVTEISSTCVYYNIKGVKKLIKNANIIITGGGFLGSIWMNEERMVRKVVQAFPENKIIIFPQTFYYEDTVEAIKEKEHTFKLYEEHKNLHIYAREEKTYNFLKQELKNTEIQIVPDIVLYLNETKDIKREERILVCMRKDKEKISSKLIEEFLQNVKLPLKYTDTVVEHNIMENKRKEELENKFMEFRKSKLVVTNRLHGMIFAFITATPCIAVDNLTKKVSGVYKWIKDVEFIKMIEEKTTKMDLDNFVDKVLNNEYKNNKEISSQFEKLKNEIEELN